MLRRSALYVLIAVVLGSGQAADAPQPADLDEIAKEMKAELDATALRRTAPSAWSKVGWRKLKWGMGPGDVGERIGATLLRDQRRSTSTTEEFTTLLPEPLYQASIEATFKFREGRLWSVDLVPVRRPGFSEAVWPDLVAAWFRLVRINLSKKYGAGQCDSEVSDEPGAATCVWARPRQISVTIGYLPPATVLLSYTDPAVTQQQELRRQRYEAEELEKL